MMGSAMRMHDLLVFLAKKPGWIATPEQMLEGVWNSNQAWQTPHTVAEHIYRLRKKLEPDPARPKRIVTHRGRGYSFATA